MRLSTLRPLYDRAGPWTSVYVDASRDTEEAPQELRLRLRQAPPVVEEALAADRTPGPHGFVALVHEDELALAEPLPRPPAVSLIETGPVPRVVPMLEQRGEEVAWLRVEVDRTGGRIQTASAGRTPRVLEVEGDAAYEVTRLAEQHDVEVLIVDGDVRARQLLVDQLPKSWQELLAHNNSDAAISSPGTHFDRPTRSDRSRNWAAAAGTSRRGVGARRRWHRGRALFCGTVRDRAQGWGRRFAAR